MKCRWPRPYRQLKPLGIANRTKSPALEKASRTGHPKFRILTPSGRTGVVLRCVAETISWNGKGRATRPTCDTPIPNAMRIEFHAEYKGTVHLHKSAWEQGDDVLARRNARPPAGTRTHVRMYGR